MTEPRAVYDLVRTISDKDLYEGLSDLSLSQMKRLSRVVCVARRNKYARNRVSLYGNLNRCFSRDDVVRFFGVIRNPHVFCAFGIILFFSLRVSELQNVVLSPCGRFVKIVNSKAGRNDFIPLIPELSPFVQDLEAVKKLSPDYLRKCFRAVRRDAGKDFSFVYANARRGGRPCYQYSTHSLRHTGINLFGCFVGDMYKTSVYARHNANSRFGVTAVYRHYDMDFLRRDMCLCFSELFATLCSLPNSPYKPL